MLRRCKSYRASPPDGGLEAETSQKTLKQTLIPAGQRRLPAHTTAGTDTRIGNTHTHTHTQRARVLPAHLSVQFLSNIFPCLLPPSLLSFFSPPASSQGVTAQLSKAHGRQGHACQGLSGHLGDVLWGGCCCCGVAAAAVLHRPHSSELSQLRLQGGDPRTRLQEQAKDAKPSTGLAGLLPTPPVHPDACTPTKSPCHQRLSHQLLPDAPAAPFGVSNSQRAAGEGLSSPSGAA